MPEKPNTGQKLMLIDAYALFNRAFYALPGFTTSDGQPTGAIYGLASMMFRLLDEVRPDYVAVAFDYPGPTFRHEVYEQYKGTRGPMPDDLRAQVPLLRSLIEAMNLSIYELERFEADDIIGTLAKQGEEAGLQVTIVTGDRDLLQLVSPHVEAVITRRGISEIDHYDVARVKEHFGVDPKHVVDFKGLTGDSSDNIPGVPGIGPKTAERLLGEYETLDNLLEHAGEVKGRAGKALVQYAEQARLSMQLATIQSDLPVKLDWKATRFHSPISAELMDLFRKLEFARLLEEAEKRFPKDVARAESAEPDETIPVDWRYIGVDQLRGWVQGWADFSGDALMIAAPFDGEAWRAPAPVLFVARRPLDDGTSVEVGVLSLAELADQLAQSSLNDLLKRAWSGSGVRWIAHDAKNVLLCLNAYQLEAPTFADDLMLASYVLNPGQGDHSPSDIALKYVQESIGDLSFDAADVDWNQVGDDGGRVCEALLRSYDVVMDRLTDEAVHETYRSVDLPLVPVLTQMEEKGVALDVLFLEAMSQDLGRDLELMTQRIYDLAGAEFNINSPRQLGKVLFEDLGLPVKKKTKTGPSTDASVLEALAEEHEIVATLLDFRQTSKLKSTYVDALPALVHPQTGRVHTTFKQAVTATGRLSSTHPNLQNIPVRTKTGQQIRRAFIPSNTESVLMSADYSQIELRVLAHVSEDEHMIEAFLEGVDIHTKTAAEIFSLAPEAITPTMRDAAKAVNFGIVYGISSFGLARGTGLTRNEAQKYIDAYFERYPKVKKYMAESVNKAKAHGYARTLLGRKRWIPNIHSRNWAQRSFAERAAINTPIQGSAADIMKMAMIRTWNLLNERHYRAHMLLQVHDELVLEVHRDDVLPVARLVREGMEQAVPLRVPLPVQVMVGSNWLDMEEVVFNA